MRKFSLLITTLLVSAASPTIASAQESSVSPYIGLSGGYHDLGIDDGLDDIIDFLDDDGFDVTGLESNGGGLNYGVVAGIEIPAGDKLSVSLEGNFHLGDGPIDNEYGVAALLNYKVSEKAKLFVKGGYQEIEVDALGALNIDEDDLTQADRDAVDDADLSAGDYIVGVGAEYNVTDNVALRGGVDSVSFETVRGTVALLFKF